MKKIILLLKSIWKDPVWSKVISIGILALLGLCWAWYEKKPPKEIYELVLKILNVPVPFYLILSFIAIAFLVRITLGFIRRKPDPLYDDVIGNYKFRELCVVLQNTTLKEETEGIK